GFEVDGEMLRSGSGWGNTVSLPTWQEYMTRVHEGLPDESSPAAPERPAGQSPAAAQQGVLPAGSGMGLRPAPSAVESAGYEVEVRNESNSSVGKWYVIGTDPKPGTRLPEGETVVIRQSTGGS